jgi:hypothetical protein
MAKTSKIEPITSEEVKTVAEKLQKFAYELPPKERALLTLLVARADEPTRLDVVEYVPQASVSATVSKALAGLVGGRGIGTHAWVEAGDPWIQSGGGGRGWVEAGDPWIQSGGGGGGWVEAGDPWVQSGARALDDYTLVASKASQLGRFLNPTIGAPLRSQAKSKSLKKPK